MVSKEQAARLGSSYFGRGKPYPNERRPPVLDRIRQSRNAKIGLGFLAVGYVLQIVGNIR